MGQRKVRLTTEEFIARARAVHGDRYDYSRVVYQDAQTPVEVICPQHGPFFPRPGNHTNLASGCPACAGCAPTSLDIFLQRARAVHGKRYDYARVVYHGVAQPVEIICPEHGSFWQTPGSHTQGRGCQACGAARCVRRKDTAWFIARAQAVHGQRYDYREVAYQRSATPVIIRCPEHGPFVQVAAYHLAGNGCPTCAGVKPVDRETFLARAQAAHGDRYGYDDLNYQGWKGPVTIRCQEHGLFTQIAKTHAQGHGCPACAGLQPVTLTNFLSRAREIHGTRYDYRHIKLVNVNTPIIILCPEHGPFEQRPTDHLNQRQGCPECAGHRPVDFARFVQRACDVHGDRYSYSKDGYQVYKQHATVICPQHGPFRVLPQNHTDRQTGCPQCASERTASRSEDALADWIADLGFEVVRNDRQALAGPEIDIYLPDQRLGLEYNGAYWHREEVLRHPRHHEYKAIAAERAGIRLITVWDFDWRHREAVVRRLICHALGISDAPKLHARACRLDKVDDQAANAFYADYHIQGGIRRRAQHLGLFQDDALVACMSFLQGGSRRGKFGTDEWELIRYATCAQVRGGASRLLAAFVRAQSPARIWSYSDRQHFCGDLYPALGFVLDGRLRADYRLVDKRSLRVWPKASWQRRLIPKRLAEMGLDLAFDPTTNPRTEREIQDLAGVLRIYDAGKLRWVWTADKPTPGNPGASAKT